VHSFTVGVVRQHVLTQAVKLLNYEWPRSDTIRLRGLESSSPDLPSHLVLGSQEEEDFLVLGHSRISKVPADSSKVFIESVVIHPGLRGKGLGKLLMLKTEEYCLGLGFTTAYLTTHDQQIFYSRCGYKFSESVCAFGGSSKLNLGQFAHNSVNNSPATISKKDVLTHQARVPSPASPTNLPPQGQGPLCGPPPPPPLPPTPSASIVSPRESLNMSEELILACEKAYQVPSLPASLPQISEVPAIDMSQGKSKNFENSGGQTYMKKSLR